MSWMDSWSRPNKSQATPPPFYLTHGDSVPYCHTCGRVIGIAALTPAISHIVAPLTTVAGTRRANTSKAAATEVKYCSDKCKRHKPSNAPESLERKIGTALAALLEGLQPPGDAGDASDVVVPSVKPQHKLKKGDPRIIVKLSELETAVFGNRQDPEKVYGRRKNRKARFIPESGEWKSVDMEDRPMTVEQTEDEGMDTAGSLSEGSIEGALDGVTLHDHIRLPQTQSDVNFSVGGERGWSEKIDETPEMLAKRREGQKKADEKALVKSAARRAVAFGLLVDSPVREKASGKKPKKGQDKAQSGDGAEQVRRKCEALMNGQVVEPSFAKGDWSIRWRED